MVLTREKTYSRASAKMLTVTFYCSGRTDHCLFIIGANNKDEADP